MKITRKLIRHLIIESLTGRRLDPVAKRITYDIVEALLSDEIRSALLQRGQIKFNITTQLPKELVWLAEIIVHLYLGNEFKSAASYSYLPDATDDERSQSVLNVHVLVPSNYNREDVLKNRYMILSNVRHELEHSGQPTDTLSDVQSKIEYEEDIFASPESIVNYYTSSAELPAHAVDWVLKAKTLKQNPYDVLDSQLYNIYAQGIRQGHSEEDMQKTMETLVSVYYPYYKKRWRHMKIPEA